MKMGIKGKFIIASSKNNSLADFIEENAIPYEDNYWINGKGIPSNWGGH